ncbi:YfiR family protein [bacterium]|nr:YfiR family protein [bacterium]
MTNLDAEYGYEVKAVFIYNFTKYINWIDDDRSPYFDIAVIGESPITEPLKQIAQKRLVCQKKIKISQLENADQIDYCHIIFIPESEKSHLKYIVSRVQNKNILIVCEIKNSLESGAMINFVPAQDKIKFEINLLAMNKSSFNPGSELLKLAVRLID